MGSILIQAKMSINAPKIKLVPLPLRAERWRIAPAPISDHVRNELLKNELPPQPTLRQEIAAYKTSIQEQKAARLAAEAAAHVPVAAKRKPRSPIALNRESSKFRSAVHEWASYWKDLIKYKWNALKTTRHRIIPVLCCLTAEVDNGAYEPSNRERPPENEQ